MSDALVSPAVGAGFWAVSGFALFRSAGAVSRDGRVPAPLAGVLGAFVFAIQMVNFAIPGTGSSGHLGGGLLLAILLGPPAAFVTLAAVLTIQALFFADGGLLALGCNLFNMGVLPIFVAYPLLARPLARRLPTAGTVLAAVAALGLGAVAVAVETRLSGIASLPFRAFLGALVPIHLAIGLAEGAATAALARFLLRARPELAGPRPAPGWKATALVGALALLTGGCLAWAASRYPDGLEWAVARIAGRAPGAAPDAVHRALARIQSRAPMPDYALRTSPEPTRGQTSLAGLVGGSLTLGLVALAAAALRRRRKAA